MAPLNPPRPSHAPPPNWPSEVFYLTAPLYQGLPAEVQALVQTKRRPPVHQPNQNVEIKFVTDPNHPAYGQRGLYAKKLLKRGELIIWYTGHVHLDPEPDDTLRAEREKSDYDLTLCSRLDSLLPLPPVVRPPASSATSVSPAPAAAAGRSLDSLPSWASLGLAVDAAKCGNEARFCNDYRGVPPIVLSSSSKARPPSDKKSSAKAGGKASKPPPPPKSKPSAFFHSVRTTSLAHLPVLSTDTSTPAERAAKQGELRMGIWVLKEEGIAKGEEILISYGKSFWRSRMSGGEEAA